MKAHIYYVFSTPSGKRNVEEPAEAAELLSSTYNELDKKSLRFRSSGPECDRRYSLSCMQQKHSPLAISGSLSYRHPAMIDGKETVITDCYSIETIVEPIAE